MNIDETDLKILLYFLEGKEGQYTVVDVVKSVFEPENRDVLISRGSMVTYRLKKFVEAGIFKKRLKNNINYYELKRKNIRYGDSSLKIGDELIETGKAIALDIKDATYLVVLFLNGVSTTT